MENVKALAAALRKDAKAVGQYKELAHIGGDLARAARILERIRVEKKEGK